MTLRIDQRQGLALMSCSVAARAFIGLALDAVSVPVCSWLSALLGACLCLPFLCLAKPRDAETHGAFFHRLSAGVRLVWALLLVVDAARLASLMSVAADYATMTSIRPVFLLVPLAFALCRSLMANGDGVCGAAQLWLRALPVFVGIVILQHARVYNFHWLTPVFGAGSKAAVSGAISASGWYSPAILFVLLAEPGKERGKRRLIGAFLCAACSAAVLLALHAAMMPVQVGTASTQIYQLDSLISNGRATIATQLPMTVLLFVSMLILLLFELFLSSTLIQRVFGCRRGGFCVGFSCAAAIGLAVSGALYGVPLGFLDQWTPAVVCIPLLLEVAGQRIERSV